ncbi:MAG: BrnA antitoxin family protein [Treponema sp.]|nr:BrnA antitoxin family protein [Treponema sp.]MCL2271796.1 BrnA antitoxin family protein [Treponema sp.]
MILTENIIMGIVRYTLETLPPIGKEDLDRANSIKDEDIDYSDIPEITDFSKFRPWDHRDMFKPAKIAVTCKLDADIVAWLKQDGKGYQTRMNSILREVMVHAQ